MRLTLADALHLRRSTPGEAQRLGEDFFELGIAVDASPDVADDAAQIDFEPAQASIGALALVGMGIADPPRPLIARKAASS